MSSNLPVISAPQSDVKAPDAKDAKADTKAPVVDLTFKIGHDSQQGTRMNMEDEVVLVNNFDFKCDKPAVQTPLAFFGVFDGHGGTKAAQFTRDNIQKYLVQELTSGKNARESLHNAYVRTDDDFIAQGGDTSGTTAVTVLFEKKSRRFWVANVGDSRAILFGNGQVKALSKDHKADRPDEVERIKKAGGFVIHKRVMGELAISRAIGDSDFKEKDVKLVLAEPEFDEGVITEQDQFMVLACDGLYDVMNNEEICAYIAAELQKNPDVDAACKSIVKYAIQERHTRDNVSVILISFK